MSEKRFVKCPGAVWHIIVSSMKDLCVTYIITCNGN